MFLEMLACAVTCGNL